MGAKRHWGSARCDVVAKIRLGHSEIILSSKISGSYGETIFNEARQSGDQVCTFQHGLTFATASKSSGQLLRSASTVMYPV